MGWCDARLLVVVAAEGEADGGADEGVMLADFAFQETLV